MAEKAEQKREYRMEELAEEAGITVRTLRFYRERKLIHPPRREGRIAWYDETHLARLRTISALLERGHTLNGIAELAEAFDHGRNVGELLGLGAPTEETPVRLTPEALADYFGDQATPENFAASLELGYLGTDGGEIVHISRRLLDVTAALVREGIPLADVLSAGRRVRAHTDALAELFADMVLTQGGRTTEDLQRLRPLAKSVVEAELSMAMDRRLQAGGGGQGPQRS
ncbi:MerR family transcriptional regulator [Streptomyces prunicolor]|uniref:MerR family transcriptional regulator n=2 Tax=Streptomyces prunicolor TaxID=67348 RepID=A0ABU4F4N7_9ACTN|nr:MerR family transcriptional regulator [Streptomyces prunicolor]MCX5234935.1 MerR family transcriptional regulator [Streptomyces prunicolor]MDV7214926.1 MerR family transcriptional regulator [Streptomyces prunicolor]